MSSSSVLNDGVQLPQIQQKIAGIIENILQVERDTSFNGMELFTRLKNAVRKKTRDEQLQIRSFALSLNLAVEGFVEEFEDLLSSSDESIDAEFESRAESATPEYHELAHLEKFDDFSSDSESSSSEESIEAKPGSTSEGAITECDGLLQIEKSNDLPSESEPPNSDNAVNAEPQLTAEGATPEYYMLDYLKDFINQFRQLSVSGRLLVKSTGHIFSVDSLEALAPNKSLRIDMIIACLHLFAKLPEVQVGSPISFHYTLRRPLEKAAKQMAIFNKAEMCPRQVYFFPILHYNNGYSLLEVNTKNRYICHYDPVWTATSRIDIRNACINQFPTFTYTDEYWTWGPDNRNSGLDVVGIAILRMLDLELTHEDLDLDHMRIHTVEFFKDAWAKGKLSDASVPRPEKRELSQPEEVQANKRQKY